MNTLKKTDIEIATHVAMYGGTEKDALRLRRRSVPLTRKKSSMKRSLRDRHCYGHRCETSRFPLKGCMIAAGIRLSITVTFSFGI